MKFKFFKIEIILFLAFCFIGCDTKDSESNEQQSNNEDTDTDSTCQSDSNRLDSIEDTDKPTAIEPDPSDDNTGPKSDSNKLDSIESTDAGVKESDTSGDSIEPFDTSAEVDTSNDFDDSETCGDVMCLFIHLPPDMTETPRELRIFYHVEPSLDEIAEEVPVPVEDWSNIPSEVYSATPDITPGFYYLTFVLFVEGGGTDLPVAGKDLSWTTQLHVPTYTPEFGSADLSVDLSFHTSTI